jgi:hypothetical protein
LPTFKDQQQKLVSAQHQLAIWEFLFSVLETDYVPRDGQPGAKKALRVPDCLVAIIPEDTIEAVIQEIAQGPIAKFKKEIDEINGQEMVILEKGDRNAK